MALVRCILGKFLGVVCHCFPPLSEYVILIAFPLQQWLNQRASMLRYTYIACLVAIMSDFECDTMTLIVLIQNYNIMFSLNFKQQNDLFDLH
jgi:hypothetical protein